MDLVYIHHSCYALVDECFMLVFDYWQDPDGKLQHLLSQAGEKAVYFVTSHFHQDHYNADIVEWCQQHAGWQLLPSYDTIRRRRIPKELPLAELRPGVKVETPHFTLHAYHSTDVGVCTVTVLKDGTTLYHAGDNNNWYFPTEDLPSSALVRITPDEMEKLYLSTLREIRQDFAVLDHAMIPVDDRLGQEMLRGPLQLLRAFEVKHVHPMHYCLVTSN